MLVVLAASPSLDRGYLVDALRPGEIHRPARVAVTAGGKALNVARVAHALGTPVHVVAALGGEPGAQVAGLLAAAGVPTTVVPVTAPTRSCVSVADAGDGRLTELYERAEPPDDAEAVALLGATLDRLRAAPPGSWLVVAGSWPLVPARLDELCRTATALGARVAVDTHGPALAAALAARPDVVKVNRAELAGLAGAGDAALAHLPAGCLAVVTDGARGAEARCGPRRWHVGVPATGPYPVGSGDAFLAGLLTGFTSVSPAAPGAHGPEAALALAAGTAAANAQTLGAGTLDPVLARALAARATVSPQHDSAVADSHPSNSHPSNSTPSNSTPSNSTPSNSI